MSELADFYGPNYLFKLGIKVLDLVPILGKTNCLSCMLALNLIKAWGSNEKAHLTYCVLCWDRLTSRESVPPLSFFPTHCSAPSKLWHQGRKAPRLGPQPIY